MSQSNRELAASIVAALDTNDDGVLDVDEISHGLSSGAFQMAHLNTALNQTIRPIGTMTGDLQPPQDTDIGGHTAEQGLSFGGISVPFKAADANGDGVVDRFSHPVHHPSTTLPPSMPMLAPTSSISCTAHDSSSKRGHE